MMELKERKYSVEVKERMLPKKEALVDEALKYDKIDDGGDSVSPSTAYMKGLRRGIGISLEFVQDYWKHKLENLIK